MKRYRILSFDFDSRVLLLQQPFDDNWEDSVKQQWQKNAEDVRQKLLHEFGSRNGQAKIKNFLDLGPRPFSVLAFHNRFAAQIRNAFVVGSYYPALTAACALGERILNHLTLRLRDYYRGTSAYKHVYRKDSFDNWQIPINALRDWKVLLPEALGAFERLQQVRNRVIHFHPETDTNDRSLALNAIQLLDQVISIQFPVMGRQPWFIPNTPGESYLKGSWESQPFIREIYLPNCVQVGPHHVIESLVPRLIVRDSDAYPDRDISDEEFIAERTRSVQAQSV